MNFLQWLKLTSDPRLSEIKQYAMDRGWSEPVSLEDAFSKIREDQSLDQNQRLEVEGSLRKAWDYYVHHLIEGRTKVQPSKLATAASVLGVGIVMLAAIASLAMVFLPAKWGGILPQLGNIEVARGLITFVFSFGVIFVALTMLIAMFYSNDPAAGSKFDRSKEVFTALIAVLGTILGFYFGVGLDREDTSEQNNAAAAAVASDTAEANIIPGGNAAGEPNELGVQPQPQE